MTAFPNANRFARVLVFLIDRAPAFLLTAAAAVFAALGLQLYALQWRFIRDIAEFLYCGRLIFGFGLASGVCAALAATTLCWRQDFEAMTTPARATLRLLVWIDTALLVVALPIGLFVVGSGA